MAVQCFDLIHFKKKFLQNQMLKWKIVSVSLFNYYFDFALYKYAMYMYAAEPHIVCFFTHPQQKPCNNQQCLPMIPSHTYYFQILQYSLYLGILRCIPIPNDDSYSSSSHSTFSIMKKITLLWFTLIVHAWITPC